MQAADWIVDIGPGAGKHGGKVVFEGTYKEILKADTLTGKYLSGRMKVEMDKPNLVRSDLTKFLEICFLSPLIALYLFKIQFILLIKKSISFILFAGNSLQYQMPALDWPHIIFASFITIYLSNNFNHLTQKLYSFYIS